MFRSATFKLTLWYLAIVMAISIVFSFAIYNVTARDIDRGLYREQRRLELEFPSQGGPPRSLSKLETTTANNERHDVLLRLLGLNLIVLVLAGFVSYVLARRTLGPIEAAHEQQKRFTADVSHELRTPLTALRMESEVALLNKKNTARELRQTLKSNLEEVSKLDILINNLLKLARLEADELQQQFQPVDSQTVINAALRGVQKLADARQVIIKSNVAHSPKVLGDADSLTQLLIILLDNAIKYSQSGKTVRLEANKRGEEVVWQVTDEGHGIAPHDLMHIFDRFYRADSSRVRDEAGGYGLGLSIAKMIADVHSGTITLKSQVNKGTTVLVLLPSYQSAQPATDSNHHGNGNHHQK